MDKQKHLDNLFRHAKEQNPVVTFGETKERFLTSSQTNNLKKKVKIGSNFLTKKLIIMLVTVSTLIISLFLTNSKVENKSTPKISTNVPFAANNNSETIKNHEVQSTKVPFKLFESLPIFTQIFSEVNQFPTTSIDTLKVQENLNLIKSNIPIFSDEYVFPKLTEEEIKANNKQKKLMLKNLEKFDKKVYAYIPTGTFDYQRKQVSVQSFYMQKTEISNLEYRTFLFDLLIQGRKDEFLIARPDQKQWSIIQKLENSAYEQHYFSHPAYDNFPVVNVSRKGAEMYCVWLTKEMINTVDDNKKSQYNDIRIPVREEWVMAASSGGTKYPYPWGDEPDRLIANAQVNANYAHAKSINSETVNKQDVTSLVTAYLPNDYGLYNMSGNAAEMVCNDILTNSVGTAGGGWKNNIEEIKILAPDIYSGITAPNVCIGFRVVMTVKK